MLDDFEDMQEKEEMIFQVIEEMKHTFSLTNELVNWAKEILDKKNATSDNINIKEVVDNCELLLRYQLEKKHLILENKIDPDILIFAHKPTIETCFRNIISNAIKYSDQFSKIVLSQDYSEGKVSFKIIDFGKGMTQDKVDVIFDYVKISTLGTNSEEGMGMGLMLVKELVDKSGGSITCNSKLGQGTTFKMTFPISNKY